MIRYYKHFLVQFSCVILLLHNVIPHDHHDKSCETENFSSHQSATNLLDWFKLAFHADFGENHLEHFVSGESQFKDINQDNDHVNSCPTRVTQHYNIKKKQNIQKAKKSFCPPPIYPKDIIITSKSHRGPPFA